MKIRTKIETAIDLRDSLELNRDLLKDGFILFNRRFPHYQEKKASTLSEVTNTISELCRDVPPLTGTPHLPTTPEIEKVFRFVGCDTPTNGMHVYCVEKTADKWTVLAYTTADSVNEVNLIATNDFEHFRNAGKITISISGAEVVYVKIHQIATLDEEIQIIYRANGVYATTVCPIIHGDITNVDINIIDNAKLPAIASNDDAVWVRYEENRDWSIRSRENVIYGYFDYDAPIIVIDAKYLGRSIFIGGIWNGENGEEYRVIKVEFGEKNSAVLGTVTIPIDPTRDPFGMSLHVVNGVPYVIECGSNNMHQIIFDDYSLVDMDSASHYYTTLNPPTDTSAMISAMDFEGRIVIHTMDGLVRYDVTQDTWNEVVIPDIVSAYVGGLYGMGITASDDLFLTASAIDPMNANYGFTVVKLPFEHLPVKDSLLGVGLNIPAANNVVAVGNNKVQDLRSWYSFKDPIFDHILTIGVTNINDSAVFTALLDTNKLINITLPGDGSEILIDEYPELPVDFTNSYLFFAQNNWHLTDGTSAYLIDPQNKMCTKSLETGNIPSAESMPFFTACKTVGRTYVYLDPFSCIFVEHDLVANSSTAYYFTCNGVMQTMTLSATLKINGIDDLFISARRAGEFWFSATINKAPKSVVFSNIPNATYASWDDFAASQVPIETWEVTMLKDEGFGVGGYINNNCLFGPAGIFSVGSSGELHRFTNAVTYLDITTIIDVSEYHKVYCGFDMNEKMLCYSHESQYGPYLSRGTIKVHSLMKDLLHNKLVLTVPINPESVPSMVFFESRTFDGVDRHTRIRAYCTNTLYSSNDLKIGGKSVKGYIVSDDGTNAEIYVPLSVTTSVTAGTSLLTIALEYPADSPVLTTDLLNGMLDYYVIGYMKDFIGR